MTFNTEIVFVKILGPFVAGIIVGYYFQSGLMFAIGCISLLTLLFLGISLHIFYKTIKSWKYKRFITIGYYLMFGSLGLCLSLFHTDFLREDYFAKASYQQLKVRVNNEPLLNNGILRFDVIVCEGYQKQIAKKCTGKLQIALKTDSINHLNLKYGDELMIVANYLPLESPYNPAEFNFKNWLANKNIYYQSFLRQDQVVKLLENSGNPIVAYALAVRKKQVEVYRQLIKDDEAFAVASTLILGYRADLSKDTLAAYSITGTIHALSVSGMHVGIIYIMLHWLLSFLDRKKYGRIFKVVLICSLIWFYALLTGFSPSVLRSAVMLTAYILAKQFRRSSNSYNILSFTAFCLLAYQPLLLWDVGFQLSFFAVFGLVYYQPKFYNWFYIKHKWLDKLWSAVAMSLAAQLATLPLSVYYFHQFPVYFIISNLFILLPITVLMYVGIAILLLKAHFLAPMFEWLIIFTNNGLKWISGLPYAGITGLWLNAWQLLLLSLLLIWLSVALAKHHKRYLWMSLITLLILQTSFSYQRWVAVKQQQVIFFSLRKNFATAFIKGHECALLTDLDENDRNFEFFVKPTLDKHKVKAIKFIRWDEDFQSPYLTKRHHQIHYQKRKFLLIDPQFNYKKLERNHSFDFVWLHRTPKQKLKLLREQVAFQHLILDASNRDDAIAAFEKEADSLKLKVYVLKKRTAVTLKLN